MLADMKIGKKLALGFAVALVEIAVVVGVSIWALNGSGEANDKAQLHAHKLNLATQVQASLAELQADMMRLASSKNPNVEIGRVLELRKEYSEALAYLKSTSTTDEERRLQSAIDDAIGRSREMNDQIMQAVQSGNRVNLSQIGDESVLQFASMKSALAEYSKYRRQRLDQFRREEDATVSRLQAILAGLGLFSVLGAVVFVLLLTRSIIGPLRFAVTRLDEIGHGEVSKDVPREYMDRGDEIGNLSQAMQKTCVSLREVIKEITSGIHVLSSSSAELSANSQQMSHGSRETSEKSHTVAAAAEQMTANVMSVASGMERTTSNLSSVSLNTEQMTTTIGEIAANSERARRITEDATQQAINITEQMNQLGQAAREIGKVTETITEISSQTNLLALNATIEAARAGSAGKGFAVVANEIKELAQQTAQATEDIKARIDGVQSSTAGGISEIQKVSHIIHDVSEIVTSIAAAIEEQSTAAKDIARNIAEATTGVKEVSMQVCEASQATQDIAREIVTVDKAAGQMTEGSEHVRTSAAGVFQVAEQLQAAVARFHVAKADRQMLLDAIKAHHAWNRRLEGAIETGKLDVPVGTIQTDDHCQFGKWLYGSQLSEAEKQSASYRSVRQLHAQFHQEAAKVAQFAQARQVQAAEHAMKSDYARISAALTSALKQWSAEI